MTKRDVYELIMSEIWGKRGRKESTVEKRDAHGATQRCVCG